MGFFDKPQDAAGLAQLSKDRVKKAIETKGWSYSVDADGDIGGGWDAATFWFLLNGRDQEVFQVRGNWRGLHPADRLDEAVRAANDWNSTKLWPKTYARTIDTGEVSFSTEVTVDYEHGVTDQQLLQHLDCALGTSHQFFEKLDELFPGAIAPADDAA